MILHETKENKAADGVDKQAAKAANPVEMKLRPLRQNEAQRRAFYAETKTIDGKKWSASDHRGKVIVLDFWATWCVGCRQVELFVKEMYDKFSDNENFVLAGVAMDKNAGTVRKHCDANGVKWTQLHEPGKGHNACSADCFGQRFLDFSQFLCSAGP